MKNEDDIQEMLDRAASASRVSSRYPGMTFEDGVRNALEWVLEQMEEDESPLD